MQRTLEPFFNGHKILNHPARIAQWLEGGVPTPITAEIDLTNRCNNKCPGCTGYFGNDTDASLSLEAVHSIIEQVAAAGVLGVVFKGGGEPTVSPFFCEAVTLAAGLKLEVGIVTNGTRLHALNRQWLTDTAAWIRISLDAGSEGARVASHGIDDFKQVVGAIDGLCRLRNASKSRCTIGTGFLVGRPGDTAEDMEEFCLVSRDIGCDYAQFRPFVAGESGEPAFVDRDLARISSLQGLSTGSFQVLASMHKYRPTVNGTERPRACHAPWFVLTVSADMNIYVCCHLRGAAPWSVGDLSKRPLAEILASPDRSQAISRIDPGKCVSLCRHREMNEILDMIQNRRTHAAFL